jgi:cardiolipin synthase
VKIYERRNAVLHAKTAVIDGVWSTVGSTNLDSLSLRSDDEVNAVILSSDFALEMERTFANDLEQSDQIQLDKWRERPLAEKIKDVFAHLFPRWL